MRLTKVFLIPETGWHREINFLFSLCWLVYGRISWFIKNMNAKFMWNLAAFLTFFFFWERQFWRKRLTSDFGRMRLECQAQSHCNTSEREDFDRSSLWSALQCIANGARRRINSRVQVIIISQRALTQAADFDLGRTGRMTLKPGAWMSKGHACANRLLSSFFYRFTRSARTPTPCFLYRWPFVECVDIRVYREDVDLSIK